MVDCPAWSAAAVMKFRNQNVLAEPLTLPQHGAVSVDNAGRAERDLIRGAAGNVRPDDHRVVVSCARDIDEPGEGHHVRPVGAQSVVGWYENDPGAACGHVDGQ